MNLSQYTIQQVQQHNKQGDIWIIIDNLVYDVSQYINEHPGGSKFIKNNAGKDVTEMFNVFHSLEIRKLHENLVIGKLAGKNEKQIEKYTIHFDPLDCVGWNSPYYTEKHYQIRSKIREFIQKELMPYSDLWEEQGEIPTEIIEKTAQQGLLALACGGPWPEKYFPKQVCGIPIEKHDSFLEFTYLDELSKLASGSLFARLGSVLCISLPPVLKFGSEYLREKVVKQCLYGEKQICLAITEPHAGSDVAQLKTTAVKSQCGKYYLVNGMKKWISGGIYSDYFTTAVRTSDEGMFGLSLLLIEKTMEGVKTRKMKIQGSQGAGTTFIVFDNVKVPVENLIGEENDGFKYIMFNFNHERLFIIMAFIRNCRVCIRELYNYCQRANFLHKSDQLDLEPDQNTHDLSKNANIRNKFAQMIIQTEITQAYMEQVMYNYDNMNSKEKNQILGGATALLKSQVTYCMEYCTTQASLIIGNEAYNREGMSKFIDRAQRGVKALAIPGGSVEIMLDLGLRMQSRFMPNL